MERVPSVPSVICLSDAERAELESLSRRATAPHRMVLRARIVLLAAGGAGNSRIAGMLGTCEDTARKWRRRYCENGLEGLSDAPRPGRQRHRPIGNFAMANITVTVYDSTENKRVPVELPDDAPANRIIAVLVEKLQLPPNGPDGAPLSYKFHHKNSGRQIQDTQTLAEAQVQDGEILRLQPEITAG